MPVHDLMCEGESDASRAARMEASYRACVDMGMASHASSSTLAHTSAGAHAPRIRVPLSLEPMHRPESARDTKRASRCRRTVHVALVAATLAAIGCSGARPSSANHARPYVIVVSLDAFRYDYLDRYHLPALDTIAATGIRAEALLPPFPSKTFPSHYTIATGLYPGHHGIIGNNFYDRATDHWFRVKDTAAIRDGRWYGGVPIWVAAEREGVKSAVYFWPGSEADVKGVRPTYWKRYNAAVPDSQRVDESLAWLGRPAAERPHLLLLYLSDVDDTTHRYGPDTPHTAVAAALLQRALARLFAGLSAMPLRDSVDVVVVSDHGMADAPPSKMIPVQPLLVAAGIDPNAVTMGDNGPTMSLWFGGDTALETRTIAALEQTLTNARVYARGATPPAWHLDGNPRGGDAIIVAELGHVVVKSANDRFADRGTHGWDPAYPEMHGIFLAAGPQVRPAGRIPAFENVHVYPFLAALLRLEHVPRTDGDARVLAPYLRTARDAR
ncbi:MAG: ectonucleotide pyrophosphatase/phosphodiesterase [bacterium]